MYSYTLKETEQQDIEKYKKNLNEIKEYAKELYDLLQPYCISIYLGGSIVEGYIKNIHDIDLILFADKPVDMCHIKRLVHFYLKKKHNIGEFDKHVDGIYDIIQIRNAQEEEHSYGSYINIKQIHLVGKELSFNFDVINKDREEYINILYNAIKNINNKKRWYQIYRGLCILKNNSYNLSEEEINILNDLHDLKCSDEIINNIKNDIINMYNKKDYLM